jgi:hypothetical protein
MLGNGGRPMTEAEWLACEDSEQMIEEGLFDRGDCTKFVRFSLAWRTIFFRG